MIEYPKYIDVEGKLYEINTDFRVAIECNRIAEDETIGDMERSLAIIYLLLGEEALNDTDHYNYILQMLEKYLMCGKERDLDNKEEPDLDYIEDMDYIEASFMSDFNISLEDTKMHWWKFNKLMNGLSNSEFGNCCVLNRIRNLRNFDVNEIKDQKERQKIIDMKRKVELKKNRKKHTIEQQKSVNELLSKINFRKE